CIKKNYPIVPGVSNPSDIEAAMSLGLDAVKFFPAEAAGGLKMIKAMSAPYVNMQFMPTGGINESNLTEYLDFNKVIACGGSWMVDSNMLDSGNFEGIKKLTQNAVNKMLGFKLAHIGINSRDEASALATAQLFQRSFGYAENSGDSSIFMGSEIEIMKHMGRGKTGHIALKTNYIKRAMRYLGSNGIMCDEQSRVYDEKGNLKLIYLAADFGGFSVHLSQK
ncbi:MAG: keto-hydroxyglutarate-aldolase/keto-deoxy-phosphogluconate aldolase, partial [Oscillospiraceae bacterium]